MAILVEALEVVVRCDAIEKLLSGGFHEFEDLVPRSTLCTDHELAGVSFLNGDSVRAFVDTLEGKGFVYQANGNAKDLVVVDMQKGPLVQCDWLEFLLANGDRKVSYCWLYEHPRDKGHGKYMKSLSMDIHVPKGWTYQNSLSANHTYEPGPQECIEKAIEAMKDGRKTDALNLIVSAVDQGSIHAQFVLGCMYCNGDVVEQNILIGKRWFEKAAEHGYEAAKESLKKLHDSGF